MVCRGQRIFAPCQLMEVSYGIFMCARIVKIQEYTNKGTLLKCEHFKLNPRPCNLLVCIDIHSRKMAHRKRSKHAGVLVYEY